MRQIQIQTKQRIANPLTHYYHWCLVASLGNSLLPEFTLWFSLSFICLKFFVENLAGEHWVCLNGIMGALNLYRELKQSILCLACKKVDVLFMHNKRHF